MNLERYTNKPDQICVINRKLMKANINPNSTKPRKAILSKIE